MRNASQQTLDSSVTFPPYLAAYMETAIADVVYDRFFAELARLEPWGRTTADALREMQQGGELSRESLLIDLYARVAGEGR